MDAAVTINGNIYEIERAEGEIRLRRYNERHKTWVNLYFPKDETADDGGVAETLAMLYIERNM